jgi:hypothetical protein
MRLDKVMSGMIDYSQPSNAGRLQMSCLRTVLSISRAELLEGLWKIGKFSQTNFGVTYQGVVVLM